MLLPQVPLLMLLDRVCRFSLEESHVESVVQGPEVAMAGHSPKWKVHLKIGVKVTIEIEIIY